MENPPLVRPSSGLPGAPAEASPSPREYTLTSRGAQRARVRAARRANLEKAQAVPRQRLYRPTERRRAASRANMQKAIAARKTPEGNASARLNALKHGLFAKATLGASLVRLGESREIYDEHLRLFAQVFAPQDDAEKNLVRRLAEAVWRRLRLHIAQAAREHERLLELFRSAPVARRLTTQETVDRADVVAIKVGDLEAHIREADKIQSQIECLLRKLIRKRSQGKIQYFYYSRRRDPAPARAPDDEDDGLENDPIERLMALSPEERRALAERTKNSGK